MIHLYQTRGYFSSILPRKVRDSLGEAFDAIAQMANPHVAAFAKPAAKRPPFPMLVVQL